MKPFKSFLASRLQDYLLYRQSLGYTDKNLRSRLHSFDRYIAERADNLDTLNPSFFLGLKKDLKLSPRTINDLLSCIRGFFKYLIRLQVIEENPLQDIPPYKENAYIPFIFSPHQVNQMLRSIEKRLRKTPEHFLNDLTGYIAIVLLAGCGLRISEPLRVKLGHYRRKEGSIYIEKTKFSKDRLIPAPKSVLNQMNNYMAVRNVFMNKEQNPYLLTGRKGKMLSKNVVYKIFHQAVRDIDIDQSRRLIANTAFGGPTPHSLRHSFAINILKRIRDQGKSPQNALPILSAYMGHRKYRYTAVYLKVLDAEHRQGLVDFAISKQEEI